MLGYSDLSAPKGQHDTAAGHSLTMRGMSDAQLVHAYNAANNVFSAPRVKEANVARPVLNDLHDRLTLALDRLSGVAARVEGFADRVLGPLPAEPKGVSGGAGSCCAVESLVMVLEGIERVANRLDEAAHRVERIG
ncbi:hypothetical protein CRT60_08705 [Azospirillum palustre]|uniref:Uncharacterized protein n=1 Tax=Azospirillum palustre TaxID=2044885 RepID=A0A2B8BKF8_9PROT|nr:hypothetical protein [Azospirillum palustre]PGH58028.1 hypothetical protein CRT60_08705 [Azospirillum palustre]